MRRPLSASVSLFSEVFDPMTTSPQSPALFARIDRELCIGCGACIEACPTRAIRMLPGWVSQVEADKCIGCGRCARLCHCHAPALVPREGL